MAHMPFAALGLQVTQDLDLLGVSREDEFEGLGLR